jgi:hypothetical protein
MVPKFQPSNLHPEYSGCTNACLLQGYALETVPGVKPRSASHGRRIDQAAVARQLYKPVLDVEIRVLELLPGIFGEPLIGKLHPGAIAYSGDLILLDDRVKVRYEALSYCWGDPIFDSTITCHPVREGVTETKQNYQRFRSEVEVEYSITRSLYSALQQLRWKYRVRYLWIDQLCVNQHDMSERASQVHNMLLIYKSARNVLVWLGEQGPQTDLAMSVIRKEYLVDTHRTESEAGNAIFFIASLKESACNEHYNSFVQGLHDLLARPWYKRLWVKQEVWAAQEVTMCCGGSSVSMTALKDLSNEFSQLQAGLSDPFAGWRRSDPHNDTISNRRIKSRPGDGLVETLQWTSNSECGDLRDRVYGVLGMAETSNELIGKKDAPRLPQLQIDYQKTVSEVYQDVMRFHVQCNRNFDIFMKLWGTSCTSSRTTIFGGEIDGHRIPSWCPNWSLPWKFLPSHKAESLEKMWNCRRDRLWMTGSNFEPEHESALDSALDSAFVSEILYLRGVKFAPVARCGKSSWVPKVRDLELEYPKMIWLQECHMERYVEHVGLLIPDEVQVQPNDIIVLVYGSLAPLVLRYDEDDGFYRFVTAVLVVQFKDTWFRAGEQALISADFRCELFSVK